MFFQAAEKMVACSGVIVESECSSSIENKFIHNEGKLMIISDNEDALPLNSEQIGVRVAELQKEKAELDAATSKAEGQRLQAQEALRETNAAITMRAAIGKTGVKFYNEPDELRSILGVMGFTLTASNRGDSIRVLDSAGKQVTLESALETIAIAKPYLVDGDTARHLRPRTEQGHYAELSRDQFSTVASKSRWISEHSLAEWEAMPQHRAAKTPVSQITARQYSALPLSAKSKLVSELGTEGIEEIMRRR
jgi:hypothetical protein